jgi:hypothetical protein
MRQVTYSYPAPDYNAIAATQSWTTATGSYVVINGDVSQAIQGTPGQNTDRYAVLPGIQRTIGVFSTGNLSSVVFYASGLDTNGRVVTASFVGATGGSSTASDSFATFTAEFHQVNYIYATSAATSAFTIGTGATGSTRWVMTDKFKNPFNMSISVITATIAAITVQDTPQDPNTSTAPVTFNHSTLATVTVSAQSNYAYPVNFTRAIVTTNTASGVGSSVTFQQAG